MGDVLERGRKFWDLNIMDDRDKVAVSQEVSISFLARRVIRILENVIWMNGKPRNLRCNNGQSSFQRISKVVLGRHTHLVYSAWMPDTEWIHRAVQR